MKGRSASRFAWSLWSLALVLGAASLVFLVLGRGAELPETTFGFRGYTTVWAAVFATFGALVAARRPNNAVGWLFLGVGVASGLLGLAEEYAVYVLLERRGAFPGGVYAAWLTGWIWVPLLGAATTMIFLLFPDGRLPSPRWRAVAAGAVGSMALGALGFATLPGELEANLTIENPFALPVSRALVEAVAFGSLMVLTATVIASVVALLRRFRRSTGDEHQQIKWVVFAASLVGVVMLVGMTTYGMSSFTAVDPMLLESLSNLLVLSFVALPIAGGFAVLRYGLYELDVVINRAVVFAVLAAFITGVYLLIAVGVGAALGGRDNLFLSVVATAVIAVAFQPVRERARGFANRLVYGKRATPYEVLSGFSDRVAHAYAIEDVLPRMARLVGEGTGAARAVVWLRVGDELRRAAVWPDGVGDDVSTVRIRDDEVPELPGDQALPVRHGGDLLGALTVEKPRGEAITPQERKLLDDLAAQAGLVLRNVRLAEELRANLEELRASRQRLVTAQDQERRRLERNIHDGAQQQLVALAVKLRLAETLTDRDPAKAKELIAQVKGETTEALENLRDLARGIYPPLLADKGLAAALEAQARKATVAVDVHGDGIGRYAQEVEAGAYFCVLEALQNISKYAEASHVDVSLRQDDGQLVFEVRDDGVGFDPATTPPGSGLTNMRDRLEALGGSVHVRSRPGEGTTIEGRVPVGASA